MAGFCARELDPEAWARRKKPVKDCERRKRKVGDGKAGEKRNSGAVLHGLFSHFSPLPLALSFFLGHFCWQLCFVGTFSRISWDVTFRQKRYALHRFYILMDNHNMQKSERKTNFFWFNLCRSTWYYVYIYIWINNLKHNFFLFYLMKFGDLWLYI